jgi:ketosteroid isomerase-like protein
VKKNALFPWVAIVAALIAANGVSADSTPGQSANSPTADPVAVPPTANSLLELGRQANAAGFRGDAAFFEGLLSEQFVMLGPHGERMDKPASIRLIAGFSCDIKEGWTLDEPRLSTIDADTYVLSYRGTFDGTCTRDGKTEQVPSPVRAATVWVRRGDTWQIAFHGQNPIFDPAAAAAPAETASGKNTPYENDKTTHDTRPAAPSADADTAAMVAVETSAWEAWKARDASAIEALAASDLAFVDIFGNVTAGREETIRFWTAHQCDVRSVRVDDATGSALSRTVGILTFKGILEGSCGGQQFPVIHGTSVYVREGEDWKLAFTLNHLVKP